ncbi:prepilin-type N-terminal cleavage/methylation domain-containing protein [Motiliproteus sediminis]|uniref:prepilin-type N-terminal cleavage/methylation domain-containing protein n=1 Tax=Motiliproteus sediminis TaxID=1468178 RepID=UPI001AEF65B6|nr:prepilin-type N-terminal cleavage/methylation domain-containing protein [Motiliproteus sediminis]
MRRRIQAGFTLVELVVVIVVLGILAFGTVSFITSSSQNYQQVAVGDRLGSSARIIIDKVSRELRGALPNSVRASSDGRCIEWVPVAAAGTYLELARGAQTSMPVIPLFEEPALPSSGARVSVYPINTASTYAAGGPPAITNSMAELAISVTNPATNASAALLSFASAPGFGQDSPQRRWYLVGQPASFCALNGRLYRYQDYAYANPQPDPAVLPSSPATGRWLVADEVFNPSACGTGNTAIFRVSPATLQRNAIVLIDLCLFNPQGGNLQVAHEVQLRNVP